MTCALSLSLFPELQDQTFLYGLKNQSVLVLEINELSRVQAQCKAFSSGAKVLRVPLIVVGTAVLPASLSGMYLGRREACVLPFAVLLRAFLLF